MTEKKKKGRPEIILEDYQVDLMVALAEEGVTQERIARRLGVSESYLQKKYGDKLKAATAVADTNFEQNLYRMAMSGKHQILSIFWAKARLGYRDNAETEDPNKKPHKPLKWRVTAQGERIAKSDSEDDDD